MRINKFSSGVFIQTSHRSDCDHSVQGFTVFYFASFCLDADQVSEVLKVEEQQVIPKVQERQTLHGEKTDRESEELKETKTQTATGSFLIN